MRILVAEDDAASRRLLESALAKRGYEIVSAADGREAWEALERDADIALALLDWMMPEMSGPDVCRRVRDAGRRATYLILVTAKGRKEDVVHGLDAGADDYIAKPFNVAELLARVSVGVRVARLQSELELRVSELEEALTNVKRLQGLLPICSYCKNIRDDRNYWHEVDAYITQHSEAQFSHGICPSCYTKIVDPQLEARRQRLEAAKSESAVPSDAESAAE